MPSKAFWSRLSFAAVLAAGLAAQQQPTTIRVPVRLVAVPTLALSKQGRVIDGLEQNKFYLYDNQSLQNIKVETSSLPLPIVLAIQANDDVREYLSFITKVRSVIDTILVAQTGEAAVVTYNDEVIILNPSVAARSNLSSKHCHPAHSPHA